jgi:hypothetical protein
MSSLFRPSRTNVRRPPCTKGNPTSADTVSGAQSRAQTAKPAALRRWEWSSPTYSAQNEAAPLSASSQAENGGPLLVDQSTAGVDVGLQHDLIAGL